MGKVKGLLAEYDKEEEIPAQWKIAIAGINNVCHSKVKIVWNEYEGEYCVYIDGKWCGYFDVEEFL